jgi:hypothetical protein
LGKNNFGKNNFGKNDSGKNNFRPNDFGENDFGQNDMLAINNYKIIIAQPERFQNTNKRKPTTL